MCPSCGKTGFVSVNGKRYCSNCGAVLAADGPKAMADIRPAAAPTTPAATLQAVPVATPATQLHGKQVGAGVLDLRKVTPAPQPVEVTPEPVAAPPAPSPIIVEPSPVPMEVQPEAPAPEPVPAEPIIDTPPAAPVAAEPPKPTLTPSTAQRLENAAGMPKSELVQKFPPPAETPPLLPSNQLPNAVTAQVEAMKKFLPAPKEPTNAKPQAEELRQALAAAKPKVNPLGIAAATAAIAIMGVFIWLQNSPKLAFHSAAGKAGVAATLPSYMPASYRQSSDIQYKQGEVTLAFTSPSTSDPLSITQRSTNWDSNSLRENYVSKQTDNYLAVQGQGLTIYLYNQDHASWVNHGIWYSVAGTRHLSREQILKIAYSL